MSLLKSIKRLEYANYLIKKKATGSLDSFAQKMQLSKSGVKELIREMREMGAKISFDRIAQSYFYIENGEMCISKFMNYGEVLSRRNTSLIGATEELCFSELAIFVLCSDI